MVSPHESWEEKEDGFKLGKVFVEVLPVQADVSGSAQFVRSVSEKNANAYQVNVFSSYGTVSESPEEIAIFENPREAWEMAHILTHYLKYHQAPTEIAISDLKHSKVYDEQWYPEGIIEDIPPDEVFWKMVTRRKVPEPMSEVVGEYDPS